MAQEILKISTKDGAVEAILTPSSISFRLSKEESDKISLRMDKAKEKLQSEGFIKKLFVNSVLFLVDFYKKKNNCYELFSLGLEKINEIHAGNGNLDIISKEGKNISAGRKYDFNLKDQEPTVSISFSLSKQDVFYQHDVENFVNSFNKIKPQYEKYLESVSKP